MYLDRRAYRAGGSSRDPVIFLQCTFKITLVFGKKHDAMVVGGPALIFLNGQWASLLRYSTFQNYMVLVTHIDSITPAVCLVHTYKLSLLSHLSFLIVQQQEIVLMRIL